MTYIRIITCGTCPPINTQSSWAQGLGPAPNLIGGLSRARSGTMGKFNVSRSPVGNLLLLRNYPNPFNAVTTIQFYLPKASNIRISVVNTNGRLVEVLKQGYAQEGLQTLEWAATGRASGVYSLVLESGGRKQVRAMSLIR